MWHALKSLLNSGEFFSVFGCGGDPGMSCRMCVKVLVQTV